LLLLLVWLAYTGFGFGGCDAELSAEDKANLVESIKVGVSAVVFLFLLLAASIGVWAGLGGVF
jgi:hypothetical protein